MNGIFDSHAHYDDKGFDEGRCEVIEKLPESGIEYVVNAGADMQSSFNGRDLSERYPFIYFAAGVHPQSAQDLPGDYLAELKKLAARPKCVAIGEIGLDYYYKKPPHDVQQKVFEEQLNLARELDMPIIIHDREAHEDTLTYLKKYHLRGVVHCFSGSPEMAKEVVGLGMYLGFNGMITFKNVRKAIEVIRQTPIERILLETDCPYMAPVPLRGKRCDSSMIPYTGQKIADIKSIPLDDVISITNHNAKMLYGIE